MSFSARRLSAVILLCASFIAHAQYVVKKLAFVNPGSFTEEQLQAACGLKVGQSFTAEDLQKAAQHMIDTGAFEELSPALTGPFKGITVTFTLKPAKLLPAAFDNFVWFTSSEINTSLHERIPLYIGKLPEAGNLQEQVRTALVKMLADKGIQAEVTAVESMPTPGRPMDAVVFSITSPSIVLDSVALSGITPEMKEAFTASVQKAINKPYFSADGDDTFLDVYQEHGYLDAKLTDLQKLPSAPTAGTVKVRITGTVIPGEPYKVQSITWAGSPELAASEFEKQSQLHAGEIASQHKLNASALLIQRAYQHNGYLYAAVDPQTTKDSATHTVTYAFKVVPGDQYRLHSLQINGLLPDELSAVQKNWKMNTGDLYDPNYAMRFAVQNTALIFLAHYNAKFEAKTDAATKLADLTVTFSPRRRR